MSHLDIIGLPPEVDALGEGDITLVDTKLTQFNGYSTSYRAVVFTQAECAVMLRSGEAISSVQFLDEALASNLMPEQRLILFVLVHYRTERKRFVRTKELSILTGMSPEAIVDCFIHKNLFGFEYIRSSSIVWPVDPKGRTILYGASHGAADPMNDRDEVLRQVLEVVDMIEDEKTKMLVDAMTPAGSAGVDLLMAGCHEELDTLCRNWRPCAAQVQVAVLIGDAIRERFGLPAKKG
jgi:hypothetical protein